MRQFPGWSWRLENPSEISHKTNNAIKKGNTLQTTSSSQTGPLGSKVRQVHTITSQREVNGKPQGLGPISSREWERAQTSVSSEHVVVTDTSHKDLPGSRWKMTSTSEPGIILTRVLSR